MEEDGEGGEEDVEAFYRSEFKRLTAGGRLLRLDQLLQWQEVKDLIAEGALTPQVVERIFDGLPKEAMGIPSTVFGIGEDAFVSFNNMLDVLLESKGGGEKDAKTAQVAATPLQLISQPPRLMPKNDKELSIGSLGSKKTAGSNENN